MTHQTKIQPADASAMPGNEKNAVHNSLMRADVVTSYNPCNGKIVWQGPAGDVNAAALRAQAAWPDWSRLNFHKRLEILREFTGRIKFAEDDLAGLMADESGRPLWDCRGEIDSILNLADQAVHAWSDRAGQRRLEPGRGIGMANLRHKPKGVMAFITPFSSPGYAAMSGIFPALLAGNAIIWKPSEKASGFADELTNLAAQSNLADGVFQTVQGGGNVGRALVMHDLVRAICFTGSAHIGLPLNKLMAGRPDKALSLQMGGNNPIIAWDTQHYHTAAVLILRSAFQSSGQSCNSARRLIVGEHIFEPLMAALSAMVERVIVGEPYDDPSPFMGPVSDIEQADGLAESLLLLLRAGGKPICHLKRRDENKPFLGPAVIDVTDMKERIDLELFGPILQVIRVKDFETAVSEANATRFHRTASLIGGNKEQFDYFWETSLAGQINWNNTTLATSEQGANQPQGLSGNQRSSGFYGCDFVCYPVQSAENDAPVGSIGIGLMNEVDSYDEDAGVKSLSGMILGGKGTAFSSAIDDGPPRPQRTPE